MKNRFEALRKQFPFENSNERAGGAVQGGMEQADGMCSDIPDEKGRIRIEDDSSLPP